MLLELAYEAMDDSGYLRNHRRESSDPVGCFIGASFVEYLDNTNSNPPTAYTSTGTIRAFLCGRLSYYFGWEGRFSPRACLFKSLTRDRTCGGPGYRLLVFFGGNQPSMQSNPERRVHHGTIRGC